MSDFEKTKPGAPDGFFALEAAGLDWLRQAGGARVAEVRGVSRSGIRLEKIRETSPSKAAAREFGRALAKTHDAGAPAFGCPPPGYNGPGWFGPLGNPFEVPFTRSPSFGAFYAERLDVVGDLCGSALSENDRELLGGVIERLRRGDFDGEKPARLHGDLWSGNLLWADDGAVLIDPAAHGGHRVFDLAMLALFGAPYLDEIYAGYEEQHALRRGWRDEIPLHQLFPLLAHVYLFGTGYLASTRAALEAAVAVESR